MAVEPEPRLRDLAEAEAAKAPVAVEVVDGTAGRLPADDGSFDAAVASLVLCSVRARHGRIPRRRRRSESGRPSAKRGAATFSD